MNGRYLYLLNPVGIVGLMTVSAEAKSLSVFAVEFGILVFVLLLATACSDRSAATPVKAVKTVQWGRGHDSGDASGKFRMVLMSSGLRV